MYQGYYINLKHSVKRNTFMQNHLKKLNLLKKYKRSEGVNGKEVYHNYKTKLNPGSLGCWLSHEQILTANETAQQHIHIIEDDTILSQLLPNIFKSIPTNLEWDIIFTDVYFSMLNPSNFYKINEKYKLYEQKKQVSLLNLKGIPFSGTSSYFVNKNSIKKFNHLMGKDYDTSVKHDTKISNLVQAKKLKAYTFIPFLSTISTLSDASTIDQNYNTNLMAMDLIRKSFYIGSDTHKILQKAREIAKKEDDSPLVDIYTTATNIILNNLNNKRHVSKKN
ncbi:MAG: glycosyltransferase family 25 protein [Campylobacterota bacterium]|nr:glycosyltransferase family 25 protein [Campylobacterota bacterium]